MTSPLVEQLADLRRQLKELRDARVGYVKAPVTAVDTTAGSFTVAVADQEDGSTKDLAGIGSPAHFLPTVGDEVLLALSGARPIYQPERIATGAVGSTEIADGAIKQVHLASDLLASIGGGALIYRQAAEPDPPPDGKTAYWWDTGNGNALHQWNPDTSTWDAVPFGEGAIGPNSLHASEVLVDGSVVASLLESVLVLATALVAGDVAGIHAELNPDGLHIYNGAADEIGRFATTDGTIFGILDTLGNFLASIDDAGGISAIDLNVDNDPIFQGTALSDTIAALPRGVVAQYADPGTLNLTGIAAETHVISVTFTAEAGRHYTVRGTGLQWTNTTNGIGNGAIWLLRATPAIYGDTTELTRRQIQGGVLDNTGQMIIKDFVDGIPAGTYQIALNAAPVGSNIAVASRSADEPITLVVEDKGPVVPASGQSFTSGGAGGTDPAPAPTNYQTTVGPSGHWSYRGNGTLRTDTTDVVQGLDPSGFNGDGQGGWNFTIPNITGTVTRVGLFIYTNFTYFNSGGKAKIRLVADAHTFTPTVLQGTWIPSATYPKPGGVWVNLPSSWFASFKGRTSIGIYLGPGGSDETYYIRASGTAPRLDIRYTQ